jgi:excisionase family DNA binding protein
MPTNEVEKLLHDKKTTAQLLSVSKRTVDNLISGKKLKTVRIGRRCLIRHGLSNIFL